MDTRAIPILVASAISVGAALSAWSDELLPPLRPNSDVVFNPPACGKNLPTAISAAHLVAKTADRLIGPYTVQLDGLVNPENFNSYRPILIEADAGDTLRIDVDNQLQPSTPPSLASSTNLHTHGLIVRPTLYDPHKPCPGDSVYQQIDPQPAPGALHSYRIDIPSRLPAAFFGLGGPSDVVAHPSGLFWFHAHLHTVARAQVTSGFSGLIAIGDPMTHLRVDRQDSDGRSQVDVAATRALRAQTDVRYLALRDIQLTVPTCQADQPGCDPTATLPGHPGAKGTSATVFADYNPSLCDAATARGNPYHAPDTGFCATPNSDKSSATVWLFTVNGQLQELCGEVGDDGGVKAAYRGGCPSLPEPLIESDTPWKHLPTSSGFVSRMRSTIP